MKHPSTWLKTKGILYYTDNTLEEPIFSLVQQRLLRTGLPIVGVSLKPLKFGQNIVLEGQRGYHTMVRQIVAGLETLDTDYVFFCEHDVLYHESHFHFTPPQDSIYYYNANVWRWEYPKDRAITYERLLSLSTMCCSRQLALGHYQRRLKYIESMGLDKIVGGEPDWCRKMGYEPGTKKKKRGGFSDDDYGLWSSLYPNVDIRHRGTFSPPKTHLKNFKHAPQGWTEIKASKIPGWNLKNLFNLQ